MEILDHEEVKNIKQTFARLALFTSLLTIFFWIMIFYQMSGVIRATDSLNPPIAQIIFSIGIVILSPLSFVFSGISIYQKEVWTLIKIAGVALSTIILIPILVSIVVLFVGFGF